MESVRRGDVNRSSCGFRVPKGGARWERRGEYDLRIISEAELVELGPQTGHTRPTRTRRWRFGSTRAFEQRMRARADAEFQLELAAAEVEVRL